MRDRNIITIDKTTMALSTKYPDAPMKANKKRGT